MGFERQSVRGGVSFATLFYFFVCSSICFATPTSGDINQETNEIKAVAQKWVELLDDGKLPGLTAREHGTTNIYQLSKGVKKLLVDEKTLSEKMLTDVNGYNDPYVLGAKTTDNKNFAYFFYVENGGVGLISAYKFETNGWARIFHR